MGTFLKQCPTRSGACRTGQSLLGCLRSHVAEKCFLHAHPLQVRTVFCNILCTLFPPMVLSKMPVWCHFPFFSVGSNHFVVKSREQICAIDLQTGCKISGWVRELVLPWLQLCITALHLFSLDPHKSTRISSYKWAFCSLLDLTMIFNQLQDNLWELLNHNCCKLDCNAHWREPKDLFC